MHRPVSIGNVIGIEHTARRQDIDFFGKFTSNGVGIDHPIDNNMTDMNTIGPQFACHRLRQRPQRVFRAGKRRKVCPAAHTRRRPGKYNGPPPPRCHPPGSFPSGQETGKRGAFPNLAINPAGQIKDR